MNYRIGDYIEPDYHPHSRFLETDAYSTVLDSIVVACVDIVLTDSRGCMLLGKRAWHPQADWWLIGGRMQTGETLEAAAIRNLIRETGLQFAPQRFSYLTTLAAAWRLRRQAPTENGTHTLSVVMTITITSKEVSALQLSEEYTDQRWIQPALILAQHQYHPALHQCALALQEAANRRAGEWD